MTKTPQFPPHRHESAGTVVDNIVTSTDTYRRKIVALEWSEYHPLENMTIYYTFGISPQTHPYGGTKILLGLIFSPALGFGG